MDIRRKGSGRRRRRSWNWSWTLREADFLRRDLYSIETFALLLLGQHLGFAQRVDLCLKKFDLLILSVGFVGGNFDFKGILFVALEEIGRDGLVLIPFGIALSPSQIIVESLVHVTSGNVPGNKATIEKSELSRLVAHDLMLLDILRDKRTFSEVVIWSAAEHTTGSKGILSARLGVPRGGGF